MLGRGGGSVGDGVGDGVASRRSWGRRRRWRNGWSR